jgi:lysophospholipase L1-like esterase
MRVATKYLAAGLAIVLLIAGLTALYFGTKHDTIRVACVGDSITEGTEYPYDLAAMLGANYTVGHFGVGGVTVTVESENGYINQTEFKKAKNFMPNIVVILLGTNDAYPEREQFLGYFKSDYLSLIEAFQSLPTKPQIYIVLPPPVFNDSMGPSSDILAQEVLPLVRQVATETGLPLVDVNTPLLGHADYFWDGLHPNRDGAKIIASKVYEAIT